MISLEDDIAQSMERAMILNSFMQSLCKPGPATLWLEGIEVLAMRVPRRSAALRAEPVALSQAKPAVAIARGDA